MENLETAFFTIIIEGFNIQGPRLTAGESITKEKNEINRANYVYSLLGNINDNFSFNKEFLGMKGCLVLENLGGEEVSSIDNDFRLDGNISCGRIRFGTDKNDSNDSFVAKILFNDYNRLKNLLELISLKAMNDSLSLNVFIEVFLDKDFIEWDKGGWKFINQTEKVLYIKTISFSLNGHKGNKSISSSHLS